MGISAYASDEVVLERPGGRARTARHTKLVEDVAHMPGDSLFGDEEFVGDGAIRLASFGERRKSDVAIKVLPAVTGPTTLTPDGAAGSGAWRREPHLAGRRGSALRSIRTETDSVPAGPPRNTPRVGAASP